MRPFKEPYNMNLCPHKTTADNNTQLSTSSHNSSMNSSHQHSATEQQKQQPPVLSNSLAVHRSLQQRTQATAATGRTLAGRWQVIGSSSKSSSGSQHIVIRIAWHLRDDDTYLSETCMPRALMTHALYILMALPAAILGGSHQASSPVLGPGLVWCALLHPWPGLRTWSMPGAPPGRATCVSVVSSQDMHKFEVHVTASCCCSLCAWLQWNSWFWNLCTHSEYGSNGTPGSGTTAEGS